MVVKKIEIKKIEENNNRQVTFSKRHNGIFKKAAELCVLTGAKIAIINVDVDVDMGQSALPINEFNQHYAKVSHELELEKMRKDMIPKKSSSEFWFDEPIDRMDVAELEHYIFSLQELKRKVLTRADELMMINNAPAVFGPSINNTTPLAIHGPTVLQHLQGPETNVLQGPNVLSQEGLNVFDNAWENNNGQYYFDHALMMNANVQGQGSVNYNLGGELEKFH
ncbi:agamous-like MADS-box protein AGL62 [Tanacetum coccineum]